MSKKLKLSLVRKIDDNKKQCKELIIQVCVKNCPVENFTPLKEAIVGKESEESLKNKLKPFCSFYTTEKDYNSLTVSQLIDKQYCPPWQA